MKTFLGGIKIKYAGRTEAGDTRTLAQPENIRIMSDSVSVSPGMTVDIGTPLGGGLVSPVSGTVETVSDGYIYIKNDFEDRKSASLKPIDIPVREINQEWLIHMTECAGIMQGGKPLGNILRRDCGYADTLIINCCENDPYITNALHVLKEEPEAIATGCKILQYIMGIKTAFIAVGENRKSLIKPLEEYLDPTLTRTVTVADKYPAENERILARAIGEIPRSQEKEPRDSGILVIDAEVCASVYYAISEGRYCTSHRITLDGDAVENPFCLSVTNGTTADFILNECSDNLEEAEGYAYFDGGIIGGKAVTDFSLPVQSSVIVMKKRKVIPPSLCLSCAKCAGVCPIQLKPYRFAEGKFRKNELKKCIHCGACACVCPAHIQLTDYIYGVRGKTDE